jgi:hypothetical protein
MLTRAQLRDLVADAVLCALEQHKQGERPERATLSGAELALRLGVSRSKVHQLRVDGMPSLKLGETFRFELAKCLQWLRERGNVTG